MATARFLARYLYVPTLLVGLNGLAVYLMAQGYGMCGYFSSCLQ